MPRYLVTIDRRRLRDKNIYFRAGGIQELKQLIKDKFGACILYVYGTDKMQYSRIRKYRL